MEFRSENFFNNKITAFLLFYKNIPEKCAETDTETYFKKSKVFRNQGKVLKDFKYLEKAFIQKDIFSYYLLYFYVSGILGENEIIPKDITLEENLYSLAKENIKYIERQALNKFNPDAIFILAQLYIRGIIFEKDFEKAKNLLLSALELNCPLCVYLLAEIYSIEKNSVCIGLYIKAFELGNLYAKIKLALIKKEGIYTRKDISLYLKALEDLSDDDNDVYLAQYYLGKYYLEEELEYKKAILYFNKAARNFHKPSKSILEEIFTNKHKLFKISINLNNKLELKRECEFNISKTFKDLHSDEKSKIEVNAQKKIHELTENMSKLNLEIEELKRINVSLNHNNNNISTNTNYIQNYRNNKKNINCACSIF